MARTFTIAVALAFALLPLLVTAQEAEDKPKVTRADRIKIRDTRKTMRETAENLKAFYTANGQYPGDLDALVKAQLAESKPVDAWGNDYGYELSDSNGFLLTSYGADGKPGGEGGSADIVYTRKGFKAREHDSEAAKLERERRLVEARRIAAQAEMLALARELVLYRKNAGEWPTKIRDILGDEESSKEDESKDEAIDEEALPQDGGPAKEKKSALERCLTDIWGSPYEFKPLAHDNFAIVCRGADGAEGGQDEDADFVVTERDLRESPYSRRAPDGDSYRSWEVRRVGDHVQQYLAREGKVPANLDVLTAGQNALDPAQLTDRWDRPLLYVVKNDKEFYIIGLGSDDRRGGKDDARDVIYPEPGAVSRDEQYARVELRRRIEEEAREAKLAAEALREVAKEQMRAIAEKARAHQDETGSYPEDLAAIKEAFPGGEAPLDPWNNAYSYQLTKDESGSVTGFKLRCLGSDGAEGGEDHAADFEVGTDGKAVEAKAVAKPGSE